MTEYETLAFWPNQTNRPYPTESPTGPYRYGCTYHEIIAMNEVNAINTGLYLGITASELTHKLKSLSQDVSRANKGVINVGIQAVEAEKQLSKFRIEAEQVDRYFKEKYPENTKLHTEAYYRWLNRNYPILPHESSSL